MSDKTETPTPRRLRKAREAGDSGASAAASQAVAFLVAVAVAPWALRGLAARSAGDLREAIQQGSELSFDPQALVTTSLALVLPALLAIGLAGGVVQVLQTGGVIAPARVSPQLDRLNVAAGLSKLVSGARLFAVARAFLGAMVLAWLAVHDIEGRALDIARVVGRLPWAGAAVADMAGTFAWQAAAVGIVLGLADLLVTRTVWLGRLRMTKDEVKREHRESEGDPALRAARRRAHQELLSQAAVAAVRTATVVVTNPTHLACALRYDEKDGDEAPVLVASGEGDLAARIAREAEAWGIPIVRDVPLARALIELGVGDTIPEVLYEAVAEILRALWETEGESERG